MSKMLDFLFGESQDGEQPVLDSKTFGSDLIHLFEEADKEEKLGVDKQPLTKALAAIGIKDAGDELELDPRGFSLVCGDSNEYRDYLQLLSDPDALAKLAGLGWVHSGQGDVAQHNEPAEFRIRFLEIDVAGEDDEGKEPKTVPTKDQTNKALKDIIDKGREFATTPVAVDDPSGNVDREEPDSDTSEEDGQKEGVGKTKDGSDPEGKPKGAEKGKKPAAVAKSPGKVSYRKETYEEPPYGSHVGYYHYSEPSPEQIAARQAEEERIKADKKAGKVPAEPVPVFRPRLRSDPDYDPNQNYYGTDTSGRNIRHWELPTSRPGPSTPEQRIGEGAVPESVESLEEGGHKAGCQCGFCKNKGNIASLRKGKKAPEQEQPTEEPEKEESEVPEQESAQALAARLLEDDPESVDEAGLSRGKVEKTRLHAGGLGKGVNPKGKTGGKFKFPGNWKVGYAGK